MYRHLNIKQAHNDSVQKINIYCYRIYIYHMTSRLGNSNTIDKPFITIVDIEWYNNMPEVISDSLCMKTFKLVKMNIV